MKGDKYCFAIEFYGYDPKKEEWDYVTNYTPWTKDFDTLEDAIHESELLEVKPLGMFALYLHYKYPHLSDIDAEYRVERYNDIVGTSEFVAVQDISVWADENY